MGQRKMFNFAFLDCDTHSTVIQIQRQTFQEWWLLRSPVQSLLPGSHTAAVTPRPRPATTLVFVDFTKSKTATAERTTKVKQEATMSWSTILFFLHYCIMSQKYKNSQVSAHLFSKSTVTFLHSNEINHLWSCFRFWLGLGHKRTVNSNITQLRQSQSEFPLWL